MTSAAPNGPTPPFRLYNTATRSVEPVRPADPKRITFYSCGPTVYDDAHIGNFRSFLAADVLRRWLESPLCRLESEAGAGGAGRTVLHVMNITDVGHMTDDSEGGENGEDRMAVAGRRLAEAKKSGKLPADVSIDPRDPYAIAAFYAVRFQEDARRLGLKVAIEAQKDESLMPRATANIDGMRSVIEHLLARGYAYAAGQPGKRAIYFDVRRFPSYGALSGNTLDSLREGAGERIAAANQSEKRDPADFLLWKEDAAHIMKWPSPVVPGAPAEEQLGPGYPGWHIECTVMSARRLLGDAALARLLDHPGTTPSVIDVHSGGEDNIFPHHECEVAQSVCAFCNDQAAAEARGGFARHWFHARHLFVEGEKMSKSKGNFFTARQLFEPPHGFEPAAVRLELVKTHYRSNANFTMQGLRDSARIVERWRRFVETPPTGDGRATLAPREAARASFIESMSEDLNVAGAIGALNRFINDVPAPSAADIELVRAFDRVLGVLELEKPVQAQTSIGVFVGCDPDPAVVARLEDRVQAKKAKDFARSDAIRDELAKMGYAIKDVAGGKVEVRRS
ncbi:MAG TPA: cysteine--tRNA ligase [Phycisphaerales bacterium]|nr:cysteine--tRNA ligase [Phycisphaerales bacterium]